MTDPTKWVKRIAEDTAALHGWIVAERAKGRTLESIAKEIGWTKQGVSYICRKAEKEGKG